MNPPGIPLLFPPLQRCREVALARRDVVERLATLPGVALHTLEETFQPPSASIALHTPAPAFTPAGRSRLVQHLLEVTAPAAGFRSCHGLLAVGARWLYEANPANAAEADGVSLAARSVLSRLLRRRWNPAAVPPGWWRPVPPPRVLAGPLVLLSSHNNPNYHHWLTLPGLAPLMLQQRFGLAVEPHTRLALTASPGRPQPPFLRPLLALVAPELPVVEGPCLSAPRLRLALQEQASPVVVSPALLAWWREILGGLAIPAGARGRRLLISRRRARSRRCLNEEVLLARLAPLGFERLDLEGMAVGEQLEAFAGAAVVVGAHGAGLTNVVACQPGATLVELLPGEGPFHHYFLMASCLGVRHGHLIGARPDPASDDFTVDPEQLLALLARCGIAGEP
ncbi:MAG: glycosyltransferase family 61 protein [Cyanobacteriota bacterium]